MIHRAFIFSIKNLLGSHEGAYLPAAQTVCRHRRVTMKGNGLQLSVPALIYRLV
jgi:hypothetical protein